MRTRALAATALATLVAGAEWTAAKDAHVNANGNGFEAGSLSFDPAKVSVKVGEKVHWENTDQFVPHTSTEDHGLWRLSGSYGSPGPFEGYGPGETVERVFEAGTHRYYCEVHPEEMKGVVEVPVTLTRVRAARARAVWSKSPPAEGLVFDVQRRRGSRPWRMLARGTKSGRTTFALGTRGTRWRVRARLRDAKEKAKATSWSPTVSIRG